MALKKEKEVDHFALGFGTGLVSQNEKGSLGHLIGTAMVANEADKALTQLREAANQANAQPLSAEEKFRRNVAILNTPINSEFTTAEKVFMVAVAIGIPYALWSFFTTV